jgi:hypothetical protein
VSPNPSQEIVDHYYGDGAKKLAVAHFGWIPPLVYYASPLTLFLFARGLLGLLQAKREKRLCDVAIIRCTANGPQSKCL